MKIKCFIIILIISFGCNKYKANDIEIIEITEALNANNEPIELSRIASKIEYIFLETSDECLIDKIDKILIDDDQVFIFNKKQFFVFYSNGKFKNSVGSYGKGPGEYLRIMDFTINTNENEIYIYDSDQQKIIVFNYEGNFICEFKVEGYPTCLTCYNNEFIYVSYVRPDFIGNDYYGISIYSLRGRLIKKIFNRSDEHFDHSTPSTSLTRLNYYSDTLTFWEINLDVIYKITETDKIIPRYQISYKTNQDDKDMSKIERNNFRYSYFIETRDYIFFLKGLFNNKIKHIVYEKKSKNSYSPYYESVNLNLSLNSGFINDIDGGYPFLPYDLLRDGRLYSVINLYDYKFKKLLDKQIIETNNPIGLKIQDSKLIDNPAVMLVTLK
jgi:hypothetical protein